MISKHVNYIFEINNQFYNTTVDEIYNKIQNDLINLVHLDKDFDIIFVAYNNTNLKITFKNNLSDQQERLLIDTLKYL